MSIKVKCSECGKGYQIADDKAGLRIRCAECQSLIRVPATKHRKSKRTSSKKDRRRSPVERGIVWGAIALLLIFAGIEWHGRHGYSKTISAFQEAVRADEQVQFTFANAQTMVSGWPIARSGESWTTYRWPSLIHTYKIKLSLGFDQSVVSVDTEFDESNLQDTPIATDKRVDSGNSLSAKAKAKVPEQASEAKPPAAVVGARFIGALTAAGKSYQKSGNSGRFRQQLQTIADKLPEVRVSTDKESPVWNKLTINSAQTGVDAFKFKSPLDQPADMRWIFSVPNHTGNWYILPVRGNMRGFSSIPGYHSEWNLQFDGVELPEQNLTVFQSLTGGQIQPHQEYIIWFVPPENTSPEITFAINLSSAETSRQYENTHTIAESIGTKFRHPAFKPTPEGVLAASKYAHRLATNGRTNSGSFNQTLRSIAPALQKIQIRANAEQVEWNRLRHNEDGMRFDAVRFSSPIDQPADMYFVYAMAEQLGEWGIVPIGGNGIGAIQAGNDRIEVNLDLSDRDLPINNIAVFTSVLRGQIIPGQEYVLWFTTPETKPFDLHLAMRLEEAQSESREPSARRIAEKIGLTIPETPDPTRVREALRRAQRRKSVGGRQFNKILQSIRSSLPTATVAISNDNVEWNTTTVNKSGLQVDAIKFTSPLEEVADMLWVFGKSAEQKMRWHLIPADEEWQIYNEIVPQKHMTLPGVELPEDNIVVFQSFLGGRIQPGREYIIWFVPEKNERIDLKYAITLVPGGKLQKTRDVRLLARGIGIKLPAPPAPAGSYLLEGHDTTVSSVLYSPDGELLASADCDGTVRLWNAATSELEATLKHKLPHIESLAFSPNGQILATGCNGPATVTLWDLKTYKKLAVLPKNWLFQGNIEFSPDGKTVAAYHTGYLVGKQYPGEITFWNVNNRKQTGRLQHNGPRVTAFAFTADGKFVITAGFRIVKRDGAALHSAGYVALWDATTHEKIAESQDEALSSIVAIYVSPDGQQFTTYDRKGEIKTWDLRNVKDSKSLNVLNTEKAIHPDPRFSASSLTAAYSTDGKYLTIETSKTGLTVWDVGNQRVHSICRGHTGKLHSASFAPDGRWVAASGDDGTVRLWDLQFPGSSVLSNSIGMTMVPIQAGEFLMGSPDSYKERSSYMGVSLQTERPQHQVKITQPFYLGAHEVTVGQFRQFVESMNYVTTAEQSGGGYHLVDTNGFRQKPEYMWKTPGFPQQDNHPVVQISWHDAVAFCNWLSKQEDATYRLPTEAEWEYACRAGHQSAWSIVGGHLSGCNTADAALKEKIKRYGVAAAWNDGFAYTAPVGSYTVNDFGLFDMHGNVFEWCSDWYDRDYYLRSHAVDPKGPDNGKHRVQRGGGFFYHTSHSRSACRDFGEPTEAQSCVGFRVVREIAETANRAADEKTEGQP